LLALVFAASVGLTACDIKTSANGDFSFDIAAGKFQDNWERSYTVAPGGRLELINVNGRITAEASDGNKVELVAVRTAKATSDEAAKSLMDKIEMREEVADTRVRVEVRPPRFSGMSGQQMAWTIKVPKGVHVDLRTVNGGVDLIGLTGEVRAKTTNGGVKGSHLAATSVEASAVNGGINLDFDAPLGADAKVDVDTVNGGVELGIPGDSKATIDARCVNGGVNASEGLNIQRTGETDDSKFERKRHLQGTMNGGGAKVTLNTVNGGIRIGRSGSAKPTT
jgi:hypothetical protein